MGVFCVVWPVFTERDVTFTCTKELPKSICIPEDYAKAELPFTENPNQVGIIVDIDDVLRIDDVTKTITFSTYFNVEWNERRLNLQQDFGASFRPFPNYPESVMVPMSKEVLNDLWIPNIFIYNLKTYKVINVLNRIEGVWIATDKNVMFSQATHITFFCPMTFNKFPFDTHSCKFQVGSYFYDSSKMVFETRSYGYGYSAKDSNSQTLDYDIQIGPLKPEDRVLDYGALGNFSLAGFEILLTRRVFSYIFTYYIVSGLCVMVSWTSFLIPTDMITGRMTLIVMILLVLVNIMNNATTNTPTTECLTALGAWMVASILFVFGALVEYAAILFKKQQKMNLQIICEKNNEFELQKSFTASQAVGVQELEDKYRRIDKFCFLSFPLFFIVFNGIYWLVCFL